MRCYTPETVTSFANLDPQTTRGYSKYSTVEGLKKQVEELEGPTGLIYGLHREKNGDLVLKSIPVQVIDWI